VDGVRRKNDRPDKTAHRGGAARPGGYGNRGEFFKIDLRYESDELGRCTAAVLKKYCKENELAVSGVKSALAARVKEHALRGAA
jgi:hypothetical protein